MAESDLVGELDAFLAAHQAELVEFRRDLHAHPEVGYSEHRTTRRIALRLEAAGVRPGKVRLIFQPAEEVPGGALDVLAAGGISSVERVFALHCDPKLDAGKIGTRVGPITAACDKVKVQLSGPGGHTARPTWSSRSARSSPNCPPRCPAGSTRGPASASSGGWSARDRLRTRYPTLAWWRAPCGAWTTAPGTPRPRC